MIYLDVCCNHPDNGLFEGRAHGLQIGDAELEPSRYGRPPTFAIEADHIRLAGKRWRFESSKDWVGNWCWNRYLLARREITPRWYLVDFVTWLRGRGLFRCTTAPSEFFEWFNDGGSASPADVHRMVCDLETRAAA